MAPHARTRAALLCAATLLAATPAFAQQAANHSQATEETPGTSGQQAASDQAGRIRAITPAEARALLASLIPSISQSDAGLTAVRLSNGALAVDLQGRFESATLAKIGPDGTVEAECVTNEAEARRFLGLEDTTSEPVPTTAPVLEER